MSHTTQSIDLSTFGIRIGKPSAVYLHTSMGGIDVLLIGSSSCLYDEVLVVGECAAISIYISSLVLIPFYSSTKFQVFYENTDNNVDFKAVFQKDSFVYFLYNTNITHSKLGKMCTFLNDTTRFNSFEDTPIQCIYSGRTYHLAQHALQWNNYIYVAFTDGSSSVICRYTFDAVTETFKRSRQQNLKCPYGRFTNKVFKKQEITEGFCYVTDGNYCTVKDKGQVSCPEVSNNGFCNTHFFGSVEGSVSLESGTVIYYSNNSEKGAIIRLGGIIHRTYAVLFIGTTYGMIGKVFVNDKDSQKLGDFAVIQRSSPVLDIKVNGEDVYVLTENVVMNVANKKSCSNVLTCEDCMKSENPNCGWDILQKSCVKYDDKNNYWLPAFGKKCLKAVTREYAINESTSVDNTEDLGVLFTLEPYIKFSDDLMCKFRNSRGVRATRIDFTFRCVVTVDGDPLLLNVTLNDTVLISTTIKFYKCSYFKSCNKCLNGRVCFWCANEFSCRHNGICDNNINISATEHCPSLNVSCRPVLLYARPETSDVTIEVINFDIFDLNVANNLTCELSQNNTVVNSKQILLNDNLTVITCSELLPSHPRVTNIQYKVRLKYNNIYVDNAVDIIVYSCSGLLNGSTECAECQRWANSGYNCQWCYASAQCYNFETETCNNALSSVICYVNITKIFPTSGPVNGGTLITIWGENLGAKDVDIALYFGRVKCILIEIIRPYSMLTCSTDKTNSAKMIEKITIYLNDIAFYVPIHENFRFKTPTITYFYPTKGILFGYTTVTVYGTDIGFQDADRYNIYLCNDNVCLEGRVYSIVKDTEIEFKTGPSTVVQNMTRITIQIDRLTNLTLTQHYSYLPDPHSIRLSNETKTSFKSGGVSIAINGEGFDNVGQVTIDNVDEPCNVLLDNETSCKTPTFNGTVKGTTQSFEQKIVNVHFDGITVGFDIRYIEDPVFELFPGLLEYNHDMTIDIKGNNFLEGARQEDYSIQVGVDGSCFIARINMSTITCFPPGSAPRTFNTDPKVVNILVKVGRFESYIGLLRYPNDVTANNQSIVLIGGIVAAILVVFIAIGTAIVIIIKRKMKKALEELKMELTDELKNKSHKQDLTEDKSNRMIGSQNFQGQSTEYDESAVDSVYDEITQYEGIANPEETYLQVDSGYEVLGQSDPNNQYDRLREGNERNT